MKSIRSLRCIFLSLTLMTVLTACDSGSSSNDGPPSDATGIDDDQNDNTAGRAGAVYLY